MKSPLAPEQIEAKRLAKLEYDRRRRQTPEHKQKERERDKRRGNRYPERKEYNEKYNRIRRERRKAKIQLSFVFPKSSREIKTAKPPKNREPVSKETMQARWRKQKFGITPDAYDALFESQGRVCAICKSSVSRGKRDFHTDHDHLTGKVRGILCVHCNPLLGHAKDSIVVLEAAISYLKMHMPQEEF